MLNLQHCHRAWRRRRFNGVNDPKRLLNGAPNLKYWILPAQIAAMTILQDMNEGIKSFHLRKQTFLRA